MNMEKLFQGLHAAEEFLASPQDPMTLVEDSDWMDGFFTRVFTSDLDRYSHASLRLAGSPVSYVRLVMASREFGYHGLPSSIAWTPLEAVAFCF